VSGANLSNPWASYPGGNPLASLANLQGIGVYAHNLPFPLNGTYVNSPMNDFHPVYMNQWNLSVQRQVGKDWLLTANYLGNSTIHMISGENQNIAVYVPGNCTAGQFGLTAPGPCSTTANQQLRRIYSLQNPDQGKYYAGVGSIDDGGTASYEGLFLSAQKRLSHGVSAQANYTWSHCISDVYNQNPTATGVAPPNNRRQFRSSCMGNDLRQLFSFNLVATTPKFSNRALRILGSDWQVAPILQIKSAAFFTVYSGTDRALTTVANQTPNLLVSNPYPTDQSVDHWICGVKASAGCGSPAFANPDLGTYGNLGYNNLKGPGVFQLNLALSRDFRMTEKRYIQLRAEAFNLPNHLNPFAPGAAPNSGQVGGSVSLTAPNFGQITNDISGNNGLQSGDYRVIQLAMKLVF
jgi:hypothetical protein